MASWKTIELLQGLGDRIGQAGGQVLSGFRQARLDEERKKRTAQQDADRELQRTLIYKQNPDLIPGQGEGTSNVPRMRTTVTKAETPLGSAFEREHPDQFVGPPTPAGTRTTYNAQRVPVQIERTGAGISPEQAKARAAEESAKMAAMVAARAKGQRTAEQDELARKKFALDEQRQRDLQAYRGKRLEATSADDPAKLEAEISRRLISAVGKKVQAFGEPTPELDQEIETLRAQLGALRGGAEGPQSTQTQPAPPEGPKPEEIAAARRDPAGTIDRLVTAGAQNGLPFDQITAALAKLGINLPPEVAQRAQQRYQALRAQQEADTDREARDFEAAVRGYREETVPPQLPTYHERVDGGPGRGRL